MAQGKYSRKALPGIILVAVGALLLLKNLGIILFEIPSYIFGWQGVLILVAVILMQNPAHKKTAGILIFIAVIGIIPRFWPLLVIAAGLYVVMKENGGQLAGIFNGGEKGSGPEDGDAGGDAAAGGDESSREQSNRGFSGDTRDRLNDISIFGGGEKSFMSRNFQGGRILAVFGGSDIDLRDCQLAEGDHVLEVYALFGGFGIHLPEDWDVQVEVLPLFGGISDKRRRSRYDDKILDSGIKRRLLVRGLVLFGGGEFKN